MVVYVHGLWLKGREAAWLCRRLSRDLGAQTRTFSYPSVTAGVAANAAALGRYLAETPAERLHLVGHSLGGLVILKLFENAPALPPGRIVLLGSPVRGSSAARRVARLPFGKKAMGRGVDEELLIARERRWSGARDLGVIAGDLAFGLGRLVGPFGAPNDGTIRVEETDLPGAAEQLTLRTSHSGMLFSAAVARQTGAFLRSGRFIR